MAGARARKVDLSGLVALGGQANRITAESGKPMMQALASIGGNIKDTVNQALARQIREKERQEEIGLRTKEQRQRTNMALLEVVGRKADTSRNELSQLHQWYAMDPEGFIESGGEKMFQSVQADLQKYERHYTSLANNLDPTQNLDLTSDYPTPEFLTGKPKTKKTATSHISPMEALLAANAEVSRAEAALKKAEKLTGKAGALAAAGALTRLHEARATAMGAQVRVHNAKREEVIQFTAIQGIKEAQQILGKSRQISFAERAAAYDAARQHVKTILAGKAADASGKPDGLTTADINVVKEQVIATLVGPKGSRKQQKPRDWATWLRDSIRAKIGDTNPLPGSEDQPFTSMKTTMGMGPHGKQDVPLSAEERIEWIIDAVGTETVSQGGEPEDMGEMFLEILKDETLTSPEKNEVRKAYKRWQDAKHIYEGGKVVSSGKGEKGLSWAGRAGTPTKIKQRQNAARALHALDMNQWKTDAKYRAEFPGRFGFSSENAMFLAIKELQTSKGTVEVKKSRPKQKYEPPRGYTGKHPATRGWSK